MPRRDVRPVVLSARCSASSASATVRRRISAAGRTSWTSAADWPVKGRNWSPRPARMAAISAGPATAGSTVSGCSRSVVMKGVLQRAGLAADSAPGVGRHDRVVVDDLDRVQGLRVDDTALPLVVHAGLGAREEPGAHAHALCSEGERRGEACATGDAARGQHRDVAGERDDLGDEDQGRAPSRRVPLGLPRPGR